MCWLVSRAAVLRSRRRPRRRNPGSCLAAGRSAQERGGRAQQFPRGCDVRCFRKFLTHLAYRPSRGASSERGARQRGSERAATRRHLVSHRRTRHLRPWPLHVQGPGTEHRHGPQGHSGEEHRHLPREPHRGEHLPRTSPASSSPLPAPSTPCHPIPPGPGPPWLLRAELSKMAQL